MQQAVLAAVLTLTMAVAIPVRADDKPQPRYDGKPLAFWVERFQKAETGEARNRAAEAILGFGPDAAPAVPALVEMLDDRSPDFRWSVGRVLGRLGPVAKTAVPALTRALKGKTARSPSVVIEVLGDIGPEAKEAVPLLLAALGNEELEYVSACALCQIGPAATESLPTLTKIIRRLQIQDNRERTTRVPRAAGLVKMLPGIGDKAIPALVELLADTDPELRETSASALVKLGPKGKDAIPALKKRLTDDNAGVRLEAAVALWKIDKDTAGLDVLDKALVGRVRPEEAARTVMEMGPAAKSVLPNLKAYRQEGSFNPYSNERQAVDEAIRKLEGGEKR